MSYCIPAEYLCDGKWDCSDGHDESKTQNCGPHRFCKNMFNCTKTQICIHVHETCDGLVNCPYEDDEQLCTLSRHIYPAGCLCLALAMQCVNQTIHFNLLASSFQFYIMIFEDSNIYFEDHWDARNKLPFAAVLMILNSGQTNPCVYLEQSNNLLHIDFKSNHIPTLHQKCFEQSLKLKLVKISHNLISKLSDCLFCNLALLIHLDLSHNLLSFISSSFVLRSPQMTLLSLQNNILNTANPNYFSNAHFKILQVENFRLCCTLKGNLKCTAKIPWYTSCKHLLPSESIKIVFLCILCLIFSLNVASIL